MTELHLLLPSVNKYLLFFVEYGKKQFILQSENQKIVLKLFLFSEFKLKVYPQKLL